MDPSCSTMGVAVLACCCCCMSCSCMGKSALTCCGSTDTTEPSCKTTGTRLSAPNPCCSCGEPPVLHEGSALHCCRNMPPCCCCPAVLQEKADEVCMACWGVLALVLLSCSAADSSAAAPDQGLLPRLSVSQSWPAADPKFEGSCRQDASCSVVNI